MQFPCSSRSATKQQQIIWKTKQNRTKTRKWKLVVKKNLCYRSLVLRNTFVGPNVEKAWGSLRSAVWVIKTLLKLLLLQNFEQCEEGLNLHSNDHFCKTFRCFHVYWLEPRRPSPDNTHDRSLVDWTTLWSPPVLVPSKTSSRAVQLNRVEKLDF